VAGEIREQLVEPFITATRAALGEMAATEVAVRAVCQTALPHTLGDIAAVLGLLSGTAGFLVLGFPRRTAAALAGRILAGVKDEVDENLIRDCVGEMGNVIAGQAKAILAETPYRFAFSLPEVVVGPKELLPRPGPDCLVVVFGSDPGEFTLQLFPKR
jgi:CheY-specific phosphatase CheX